MYVNPMWCGGDRGCTVQPAVCVQRCGPVVGAALSFVDDVHTRCRLVFSTTLPPLLHQQDTSALQLRGATVLLLVKPLW